MRFLLILFIMACRSPDPASTDTDPPADTGEAQVDDPQCPIEVGPEACLPFVPALPEGSVTEVAIQCRIDESCIQVSESMAACIVELEDTHEDWWPPTFRLSCNESFGAHWYVDIQGSGNCVGSPDYCSKFRMWIDAQTAEVLQVEDWSQ